VTLTLIFKHFHGQIAAEQPKVDDVRIYGELAYALLRWNRLPAGYIESRREGGIWKINHVLAMPLP
jgi:hypothetical protein